MGERGVRNAEVEGSNPLPSTIYYIKQLDSTPEKLWRGVGALRPGTPAHALASSPRT